MEFDLLIKTQVISANETVTNPTLLFEFGQTSGHGTKNGPFHLRITDPDNPMFLYTYNLQPSDFPNFREELKLFCQYPDLSQNIYDLFVQCNQNNEFYTVVDLIHFEQPVLLLNQLTKIALLTPFKIFIIPATEIELNHYLTGEAKRYKALYLGKCKDCDDLNDKIKHMDEQSNEMESSYKQTLLGQNNESRQLMEETKNKYENEISRIKSKYKEIIKNASEERQQFEKQLIAKYEKIIEELRSENTELTESKTQIALDKERSDQKNKALETQLETITLERNNLSEEKIHLSSELLQANSTSAANITEVASLKKTIEMLQNTIAENKELLDSNAKTIETMQELIAKKDEEIAENRVRIAENDKKATEHDWIASKSKQVIEKFMNKEVEFKNEIAKQTEEINKLKDDLNKSQIECVEKGEKIANMTEQIQRNENEIKGLRQTNHQLKDENDNLTSSVADKIATITMLNKKLNELEIANEEEKTKNDPWKGVYPSLRYAAVPEENHLYEDVQFF